MFRLRATVITLLVFQAALGAGCGGMTQDGPGGSGGSDGDPVDGSSDSGGSTVLDGYYADDGIIYDGVGGWGAGSTGGGGTGGISSQCGECSPFGSTCSGGVVDYNLSWGNYCPGSPCTMAHHVCELGCREEGAHWDADQEDVFAHCEDTSIRGPGFPCRADIDCVTPVGATLESNLNSSATGLGGASSGSGELRCSEEGTCAFGLPGTGMVDFAESCSIVTSAVQPGPVVGFTDSCQSGACLVSDGGLSEGTCTVSCETHTDCPDGYGCVDVLDNRYSVWDYVANLLLPPRILACVPGG